MFTMTQTMKRILLTITSVMLMGAPLAAPAVVNAATNDQISNGLCAGASLDANKANTNCDPNATDIGGKTPNQRINEIITTIINIFSLVVGVVAVIMIIIGGFRYITSGGDSGNVSAAKNTILYAIIGLVVVALAQFIVRFVLARVTGSGATGTP